jgi:hypothetical protein
LTVDLERGDARPFCAKRDRAARGVCRTVGQLADCVRARRQRQAHDVTAERDEQRAIASAWLDFERQLGRALDTE